MDSAKTIRERIQSQFDGLTRAERQLANSLLENYPVSGLSSITAVAHNADVSTPTVARMVQKLGFRGFPHFQESLRSELSAKISNPIEKHDRWAQNVPDSHILNRFTEAVIQNLRQTLDQIEPQMFDEVCALLADQERSIYLVGGRITRSLGISVHPFTNRAPERAPPSVQLWRVDPLRFGHETRRCSGGV